MTTQPLTLKFILEKDTPGNHNYRPLGYIKPVFRKSALQRYGIKYAEDIFLAEDFLFYAQLVMAGAKIGFCDAPLYLYAVRSGSASNGGIFREKELLEVNRRLIEEYTASLKNNVSTTIDHRDNLRPELIRRGEAIKYNVFVIAAKKRQFLNALRAALRVSPSFFMRKIGKAVGRRLTGGGSFDTA